MFYCKFSGERLEKSEVDAVLKETCDEEDEDGFIPYERKLKIKIFSL